MRIFFLLSLLLAVAGPFLMAPLPIPTVEFDLQMENPSSNHKDNERIQESIGDGMKSKRCFKVCTTIFTKHNPVWNQTQQLGSELRLAKTGETFTSNSKKTLQRW
ncbi:hypothetical protein CPB86DRAFT_44540 [Serendipita vermifera]|nr:hypothetical protein CPB86DRAFT_44540 [Serendipita vermifera]